MISNKKTERSASHSRNVSPHPLRGFPEFSAGDFANSIPHHYNDDIVEDGGILRGNERTDNRVPRNVRPHCRLRCTEAHLGILRLFPGGSAGLRRTATMRDRCRLIINRFDFSCPAARRRESSRSSAPEDSMVCLRFSHSQFCLNDFHLHIDFVWILYGNRSPLFFPCSICSSKLIDSQSSSNGAMRSYATLNLERVKPIITARTPSNTVRFVDNFRERRNAQAGECITSGRLVISFRRPVPTIALVPFSFDSNNFPSDGLGDNILSLIPSTVLWKRTNIDLGGGSLPLLVGPTHRGWLSSVGGESFSSTARTD